MTTNNSTILDSIWLEGSNDYQQRVPKTTQGSVADSQKAILSLPTNLWNEFETGLVNRIGSLIVSDFEWRNPFSVFKREELLPMGSIIEEVALDMIEANGYDVRDNNVFKNSPNEVYSAFHTINREDRYDLTISRAELTKAFVSEFGLNQLLLRKLAKPGQSDEYDEYRIMIQLIAESFNKDNLYTVKTTFADVSEPTAEELKNLSVKIRSTAKKLTIAPTGRYNAKGVPTVSRKEDLVLITTPDVTANLDVSVLADAFNIDRADFASNVIEIDEFPVEGIYAMLVDRSWFVCADYLREITSFFNAKSMTENYYLHHWGVYSVSPFSNAVIFGDYDDSVVGTVKVQVSGISASVVDDEDNTVSEFKYGEEKDLYVKVVSNGTITPENEKVIVPDGFTAEVSLEDAEGAAVKKTSRTYVDRTGKIYVQKGLESGTVVRVDVVSTYDNPSSSSREEEKKATTTFTVA